MGFRIFLHAIRMVFTQLGSALRISGVLYVLSFGLSVVLGLAAGNSAATPNQATAPNWGEIVSALIAVALYFWVAIGWHRFVLLDEQPLSALPRFHRDRMLAYFGRFLQTFLIFFAAAMVVVIPAVLMLAATGANEVLIVLFPLITFFLIFVVSYRLSPMLPGAAVGHGVGIADAWRATSGATMTIVLLAVVSAVAAVIIDIPGNLLLANSGTFLFGLAWISVTGWAKLMVGISIITTIYGVYVEGRAVA